MRGIYVGAEQQFQGREANLFETSPGIVMAQFDKGKLWETHSRLMFPLGEWEIEPEEGTMNAFYDSSLGAPYEDGWNGGFDDES
jgi:hypothetical protein